VKVIALSSIKGGVGKTTTAVNLAHLAASAGSRVLLWDLDPQGAATYTLRVGERVAGGGRRLVRKSKELARSAVPTSHPRLDVVPADFSLRYLDLELSGVHKPGRRLDEMLEHLRDEYDYVLLDCPPGISLTIDSALRATDAVLVPIIPAALPLRSFDQLASYVRAERKLARLQVVAFLSMVDRRKRAHRELCDTLSNERDNVLSQWIPTSVDIENMAAVRSPVVESKPASTAAIAYRLLLDELLQRMK
jgi:chromosome partitioning protein